MDTLLQPGETFTIRAADGTVLFELDGTIALRPLGYGLGIFPVGATPGSVRVMPGGTFPTNGLIGGQVYAQTRVYATFAPPMIESIDLESHFLDSGDGLPRERRYYLKTRAEGLGAHLPLTVQVGGHDLLVCDPTGKIGVNVSNPTHTVQIQGAAQTGDGVITSGADTQVTGNGFAALRAGDTIYPASGLQVRIVTTVQSDTAIDLDRAFDPPLTAEAWGWSRPLAWFDADGIVVNTGDVQTCGAGNGVIVTTPDGQHTYRLGVSNDGQMTTMLLR